VSNVHAQAHSERRAQADVGRSASWTLAAAQGAPAILGGDMNTHRPMAPGFTAVAGHGVDHILVTGLEPEGPGRTLDRGRLSDHAPVLVTLGPRKDQGRAAS
jgi:endonuclease/exonuclease/phosphatase family metal-dependent hydrolase